MLKQYPAVWLKGAGLGEVIACELRLAIVTGRLARGEKLSENGIAAEFGTSRSPVREALRELSNEGLLRLERMGAVVLGLDGAGIQELYDIRYMIESFVLERLAGLDSSTLIRSLEQIIDRMELAGKHEDAVEFSYQDLAFHEAIIAESKHSRMIQLWKSIRQLVTTVMLLTTEEVFSQGASRIAIVVDKHRKIVGCLQSRDSVQIQKGVRDYFADSYITLRSSISDS